MPHRYWGRRGQVKNQLRESHSIYLLECSVSGSKGRLEFAIKWKERKNSNHHLLKSAMCCLFTYYISRTITEVVSVPSQKQGKRNWRGVMNTVRGTPNIHSSLPLPQRRAQLCLPSSWEVCPSEFTACALNNLRKEAKQKQKPARSPTGAESS